MPLQINLKFFPRALQFIFLPSPLKIEVETLAADPRSELSLHVDKAKEHAAQMRKIAHGASALERTHERNGAEDHHHILGFDREQEAHQNRLIRKQHAKGEQQAV